MNDERRAFIMPSSGTANGNSDTIVCGHLMKKSIQISEATGGAIGATITLQGRVTEAMPWEDIKAYTGPTIEIIEHAVQAVRLVVSGYSAGTLVAAFAGYNVQQ